MTLPDNLTPTDGRTYTVPADQSPTATQSCSNGWAALRGLISSPQVCGCKKKPFVKSSADVLDYAVDFTNWLEDVGDDLATVKVLLPDNTQSDYDLTALWGRVYDETQIVVMLASGKGGKTYRCVVEATTAQGRTKTVTLYIKIDRTTDDTKPPAPEPTPANAVTLDGQPVSLNSSAVTLTIKS